MPPPSVEMQFGPDRRRRRRCQQGAGNAERAGLSAAGTAVAAGAAHTGIASRPASRRRLPRRRSRDRAGHPGAGNATRTDTAADVTSSNAAAAGEGASGAGGHRPCRDATDMAAARSRPRRRPLRPPAAISRRRHRRPRRGSGPPGHGATADGSFDPIDPAAATSVAAVSQLPRPMPPRPVTPPRRRSPVLPAPMAYCSARRYALSPSRATNAGAAGRHRFVVCPCRRGVGPVAAESAAPTTPRSARIGLTCLRLVAPALRLPTAGRRERRAGRRDGRAGRPPCGKVESVRIEDRSGSEWLDMASVAVFRDATLPPLPPDVTASSVPLHFTIHYIIEIRAGWAMAGVGPGRGRALTLTKCAHPERHAPTAPPLHLAVSLAINRPATCVPVRFTLNVISTPPP